MATLAVLSKPGGPALFELGQICGTPAVLEAVSPEEMADAICRHSRCDWGELDRQDQLANKRALESGGRLLSAYKTKSGTKVWVITEANRAVTTVLLPEDY